MAEGTTIIQGYAQKVAALMQLVTDLRAMAQIDLDLPGISVIGNQSAGKSSLVEAISRITVPRSAGTCTRCPMECRLTQSDQPWRCQLYLRLERDKSDQPLTDVKEVKFGPVLLDKTKLEDLIRRAQLAILNPDIPASDFVTVLGPADNLSTSLQFSSNVVCVDISGPELTNLSFIDLPGIVGSVGDGEDRSNIDLIKNLARRYITGNRLILLTLTMRDELHNQTARDLAVQADPNGLRTIGVLTKPDTIQAGEEISWLKVIEGKEWVLHHGYYMTKQPSMAELELNVNHDDARRAEADFFQTTEPWSLSSLVIRGRLGVPNLTKKLSETLSMLIEKELPSLRKKSKDLLQSTLRRIDDLPPPISDNPTAELLKYIATFVGEISSCIQGAEYQEYLLQRCRPAYTQFKDDIKRTIPSFIAYDKAYVKEEAVGGHSKINDGDDDDMFSGGPQMYVDEVHDLVQKSLTRELPFTVPSSARLRLIKNFLTNWNQYAHECFLFIHDVFSSLLEKAIVRNFERFKELGFIVRAIIDQVVNTAKDETKQKIDWLLKLEDTPFTQNDHYFTSYREKFIAKYKNERRSRIKGFHIQPDFTNVLAELASLGFKSLNSEDLNKLHPADPFESDMILMAEVRAYIQVAYKRIIDNIPRVIDHDFLRAIGQRMQNAIVSGLGLDSENASQRAAMYLVDDPNIMAEREKLMREKEKLQKIATELFSFAA